MKTILLFSDVKLIQHKMQNIIDSLDLEVEVIVASTYSELKNQMRLHNKGFDLYLLDMDHKFEILSLAEEIKDINMYNKVIMLSTYYSKETILEGVKIGIDDFIIKPFQNERVYQSIKKALQSSDEAKLKLREDYSFSKKDLLLKIKKARKGEYPITFILIYFNSSQSSALTDDFMEKLIKILWDTDDAYFYKKNMILSVHPFAPKETAPLIENKIIEIFKKIDGGIELLKSDAIALEVINFPIDLEDYDMLEKNIDKKILST